MRRLLGMLWPLVVGGVFLWDNVRSADATTLVSLVPLLEGRQITGVGLFENGDPKTINLHISIKGVRPWLIPSPTTITADANRIFVSNGNSERVWVLALVSLPLSAITPAASVPIPMAGVPLSAPTTSAISDDAPPAAMVSTFAAAATTVSTSVAPASAEVSLQDDPVVTPEASSLIYLGAAFISGGMLLKRRRSWS